MRPLLNKQAEDIIMANDPNIERNELDDKECKAAWDVLRGNWNQLKGKVREKWGLLTHDDLEHIAGHKDRLIGKLQERYGRSKINDAEVEREVRGLK